MWSWGRHKDLYSCAGCFTKWSSSSPSPHRRHRCLCCNTCSVYQYQNPPKYHHLGTYPWGWSKCLQGHYNSICQNLGKQRSRALPLFHAFTGSDTTSQLLGKGKKTAWEAWNSFPEVTEAFLCAADRPFQSLLLQLNSPTTEKLERYVCVLYDKTTSICSVNDLRRDLFCKKSRTMENIPPTQVTGNS